MTGKGTFTKEHSASENCNQWQLCVAADSDVMETWLYFIDAAVLP